MLNARRHCALLAAASAVAAATATLPARMGFGLPAVFAWYGALNAAAMALSFDSGSSSSLIRRVVLVAAGAALSALAALCGLRGLHAAAPHARVVVVAAVAALGALAYAGVIGAIFRYVPRPGALAVSAFGCAAAAALGFAAVRRWHLASPLWLVLPWWLGFSGGLVLASRQARRAGQSRQKSLR